MGVSSGAKQSEKCNEPTNRETRSTKHTGPSDHCILHPPHDPEPFVEPEVYKEKVEDTQDPANEKVDSTTPLAPDDVIAVALARYWAEQDGIPSSEKYTVDIKAIAQDKCETKPKSKNVVRRFSRALGKSTEMDRKISRKETDSVGDEDSLSAIAKRTKIEFTNNTTEFESKKMEPVVRGVQPPVANRSKFSAEFDSSSPDG